jgi:serine/threonine protein kinase
MWQTQMWLSQQVWEAEDDGTLRPGPSHQATPAQALMLEQVFDVGRRLGHGSAGEVIKARARRAQGPFREGHVYALKILNQEEYRRDGISRYAYQERNVMRLCKHPCLVKLIYALRIHQPAKWVLVMEYCNGGSLR